MHFIFLDEDTADEATIETKKQWLKHNSQPFADVAAAFEVTRPSRLRWIYGPEQPTICRIMEEYPRFKDPNGYVWVGITHIHNIFDLSRNLQ